MSLRKRILSCLPTGGHTHRAPHAAPVLGCSHLGAVSRPPGMVTVWVRREPLSDELSVGALRSLGRNRDGILGGNRKYRM